MIGKIIPLRETISIGLCGTSGDQANVVLEGGSWGVGKWVFPDASRINSFLFLTHRSDDDQEMIMGQSVFRNHILVVSDGSIKSFIQQLDTTYDIYGISSDKIIELLPAEFNEWLWQRSDTPSCHLAYPL